MANVSAHATTIALVEAFNGKGLVPDVLIQQPAFLLAVGLGAALTVLLATLTGFPISTTHAITGALVGAGLVEAGAVNGSKLGHTFFLPLAGHPPHHSLLAHHPAPLGPAGRMAVLDYPRLS